MALVELVQGTQSWLKFRRGGVGASEVPSLMGESETYTPLELWKIKTGRAEEQQSTFVMQRGLEAEPRIRALYNLLNDIDMEPAIFQHPDIPYLRASLDGFSEQAQLIAEFKYPGKDKHDEAIRSVVPNCYIGQVQAQLFVTGAKRCDYVSFNGESIAVVSVYPDPAYWARMLPVVESFWKHVQDDVPPPLTDRDYLEVNDESFRSLVTEWRLLTDSGAKTATINLIRNEIIQAMPHPRVECAGVRISPRKTKDGVSYTFKEVREPQPEGVIS